MPSEVAQLRAAADRLAAKDPDGARLLRALRPEFNGKTVETFAQGADWTSRAIPRFTAWAWRRCCVSSERPKAFEVSSVDSEAAYGKKLDVASADKQSYRSTCRPLRAPR